MKTISGAIAAPSRASSLLRWSAVLFCLVGATSAFAAPRTQVRDVGVSLIPGSTAGETGTLIISGVGFMPQTANGALTTTAATPFVQLGTVALSVTSSTATEIVAAVPEDMDSGDFLLLVERRPLVKVGGVFVPRNPTKNVNNANVHTYALTLAVGVGPAGPTGPEGPAGATGPA